MDLMTHRSNIANFQFFFIVSAVTTAYPVADHDSLDSTTEDISVLYSLYGVPAPGVLLSTDVPSSQTSILPHNAHFVGVELVSPLQTAINDFTFNGPRQTVDGKYPLSVEMIRDSKAFLSFPRKLQIRVPGLRGEDRQIPFSKIDRPRSVIVTITSGKMK